MRGVSSARLVPIVSERDIPGETTETVDPLVGLTLSGRFVLERLVSRGGMGKVYRAIQKPLDRVVALKVLDVTDDEDGQFRRRFFMEASLCAKLTHPHTVRIYDYGATDDGIFFIAMEYIDGTTLHDMLYRDAPVDPLRAIVMIRRVCGALAEAHAAGIVHRDLKPANILLSQHGDDREYPTVIDFGLVKELGKESELSRTGHVLGSPLYMAPEQIESGAIDGRTDVYAVGLILYYALCGKTAFKRGNPMAVLMAQVNKIPPTFAEANPALQVPPVLEWVVRRCIEKRPQDRFASMNELLRALKACEMLLRGEIPGPITLSLEEGRVVMPTGVDISEEFRVPNSSAPRSALPPSQDIRVDATADTTLLPVTTGSTPIHAAEQTSTTQIGVMVASSALGAGFLGIAFLLVLGVGFFVWQQSQPTVVEPAPAVEQAPRTVRLLVEPPGAEIERDGAFVGNAPLVLTASDEAYTVTVTAEGYTSRTVRIDGTQAEVKVSLAARSAPAGMDDAPPAEAIEPAPQPAPSASPKPAPAAKPNMGDIRDPWEN